MGMRRWNWFWKRAGKGEYLQLAYLFSRSEWTGDSLEIHARPDLWINAISQSEREVRREDQSDP